MQQTNATGNLFLKEFVRQMIMNSVVGKMEFAGIPARIAPIRFAPAQQMPAPQIIREPAKPIAINQISALQNIRKLISNPSITSIECPGPDKNVIVNQNGRITLLGLKLSESDIARVMGEFSDKTRIPLIKGVFKARLGNFAVTAVISDYVGTRFLIQRMGPMVY